MARGTQHRKRRPQTPTGVATAPAKPKPSRGVKHASWEDQLFFSRLRIHAKWVFVLVAFTFALSFIVLGVGSGSTGLTDAISSLISRSTGSSGSVSKLQAKAAANPKDAAAWLALANKLQSNKDLTGAAKALEKYTTLKPKNQNELNNLAGLYTQLFSTNVTDLQNAQAKLDALSPGTVYAPASTSGLGKALADPNALQGSVAAAAATAAQAAVTTAQTTALGSGTSAKDTWKRLTALVPGNAQYWSYYGDAARYINDYPDAIAAYKRYIKLAPADSGVPQAKQYLKQLQQAYAATATSVSTTG